MTDNVLEKKYMLEAIDSRLKILMKEYRQACYNKTVPGKQLTRNGAAVKRCNLKRDICILTLVKELLEGYKPEAIYDEDSILGFNKLIKE